MKHTVMCVLPGSVMILNCVCIQIQVGLLGLARSLQRELDAIAMKSDTGTPGGLHYVLTETVLALLRHPDYCVYGRGDVSRLLPPKPVHTR